MSDWWNLVKRYKRHTNAYKEIESLVDYDKLEDKVDEAKLYIDNVNNLNENELLYYVNKVNQSLP